MSDVCSHSRVHGFLEIRVRVFVKLCTDGIDIETRAGSGKVWDGMPYRHFVGQLKTIPYVARPVH